MLNKIIIILGVFFITCVTLAYTFPNISQLKRYLNTKIENRNNNHPQQNEVAQKGDNKNILNLIEKNNQKEENHEIRRKIELLAISLGAKENNIKNEETIKLIDLVQALVNKQLNNINSNEKLKVIAEKINIISNKNEVINDFELFEKINHTLDQNKIHYTGGLFSNEDISILEDYLADDHEYFIKNIKEYQNIIKLIRNKEILFLP